MTIWSDLDENLIASRFDGEIRIAPRRTDVGMVMGSAIDVLAADSAEAYRRFHRAFAAGVAEDAREMERLGPDLVLCDVPYRPLVAASRVGIPAVALCSLNWADVFAAYCSGEPGASALHAEMVDAYRNATVFVRPEPAMPMESIGPVVAVGPVARPARRDPEALRAALGEDGSRPIVLVALGGIPTRLPIEAWCSRRRALLLVPESWGARGEGVRSYTTTGLARMPFADVLASCDALLTKPGYCSVVEAGVSGVPTLYVPRGDWPEEPGLVRWLEAHAPCLPVGRQELETGALLDRLDELRALPVPEPAAPTGGREAAELLAELLGRRSAPSAPVAVP